MTASRPERTDSVPVKLLFLLLAAFALWFILPGVPAAAAQSNVENIAPYTGYSTGRLNVRTGPGQSYELIDTLEIGTEVRVTGTSGKCWLRIKTNDIPEGYVYYTYIVDNLDDALANAVMHGRLTAEEAEAFSSGTKPQALMEDKDLTETASEKKASEPDNESAAAEEALTEEAPKTAEAESKDASETTEAGAEEALETAEGGTEEVSEAKPEEASETAEDGAEEVLETAETGSEEAPETAEAGSEGAAAGAHEHKYKETVLKEATCTAPGEAEYTCTVCGDTYTERIPRAEHELGDYAVVEEASWFSPGIEYQSCRNCGITLNSREIPADPLPFYLILGAVILLIAAVVVILVMRSRSRGSY